MLKDVDVKKYQQDGRLAPVFFSPNYKYFDPFLQTVKTKTTVLIFVLKEFLKSMPPLISVLYAKGYHDFPLKNLRLTVPKNFVEKPFCVSLISGIEKFMPMRGTSRFSIENLLSHSSEKLYRGTLLCFTKFLVSKNFIDKRGGGGGREYHDFL